MGAALSIFNSIVALATQATAEAFREKNRKLQKQSTRLSNPIKPPEFWPTIASRRKKVPTGPYSVEGIRESLSKLVLPVGWSEEQLSNVGFSSEVEKFQEGVKNERRELYASFGLALDSLANAVSAQLNGDDEELKRAFRMAGVSQTTINRFQNLAKQARAGELEPQAVTTAISELRTLLDKTQLQKEISEGLAESRKNIAAAQDARASAILALTRRALGVKTPPTVKQAKA